MKFIFSILSFIGLSISVLQAQGGGVSNDHPTPVEGIEVSGTLPVCYINTSGSAPILSKEQYIVASLYIDPKGVEGIENLGTEESPVKLQIRGRGNSTWLNYGKKPYKLKFDKKQEPFGMGKNKHFALLALVHPHQFINQIASFEIARLIGLDYVPASQPVEVVLNGENLGIYGFYETIRADRLDIDEQPAGNSDPSTIPYGWVVEIDNYADANQVSILQTFDSAVPDDNPVWKKFTVKSPDEMGAEQRSWISTEMKDLTQMILNPNKTFATWSDKIDLQSLAKYYIIQELTGNFDAFIGSTYLYKGAGDKWIFGTIWDSDHTFTMYPRKGHIWDLRADYFSQPKETIYRNFTWVMDLVQFPDFRNEVARIWNEFYPEKFDPIYSFIDRFYNQTKTAFETNGKIWPTYERAGITNAYKTLKVALEDYALWFDALVNAEGYSGEIALPALTTETKDDAETEYFDLSGRKLYDMPHQPGIYIERTGSSASKFILR